MQIVIRIGSEGPSPPRPPEPPFTRPHPSFERTRISMEQHGERLAREGPPFTRPHASFAQTRAAFDVLRRRLFGS